MAVKIIRGYYGPDLAKKGDILHLCPLEEERLVNLKIAEYVSVEEPEHLSIDMIMKEKSKKKLLALAKSNQISVEGDTLESIRNSILNYIEEAEYEMEPDGFEGE